MPAPQPNPAEQQQTGTYEIRLRGHLDARWAERLGVPGLTQKGDGTTMLRTVAIDQAGLHGLLQRLRDLGLPLISITQTDATLLTLNPHHGDNT